MISQIDELYKPTGNKDQDGELLDKEPYVEQSDGSFKIKLKIKSIGMKKDGSQYTINPPVLYNALGKKIEGTELANLQVGNGSEIRAKLEMIPYLFNGGAGVSFKPKSVQIAKIVEIGAGTTEDLGFSALEMGIDSGEESSDDLDF